MIRNFLIVACFIGILSWIDFILNSRNHIQAIESLGRVGIVNTHQCRWPLCPYKGIDTAKAAKVVANYVGEAGIDAYYIDMLHIKYPDANYDTLDSLLTH